MRRFLSHTASAYTALLFTLGLVLLLAGCASSETTAPYQAEAPRGIVPPETTRSAANVVEPDSPLPPVQYVEELLIGRVAGVQVKYTPQGDIRVVIRGTSHLTGSNEPIYVVDGMIVVSTPGRGLAGISPYDVASIEVLKSGAATAIYGMQGANGAVLVTTKLPNQQ